MQGAEAGGGIEEAVQADIDRAVCRFLFPVFSKSIGERLSGKGAGASTGMTGGGKYGENARVLIKLAVISDGSSHGQIRSLRQSVRATRFRYPLFISSTVLFNLSRSR